MVQRVALALLFACLANVAWSAESVLSHARLPGESADEAFARYARVRDAAGLATDFEAGSAYSEQVAFAELDVSTVPEWTREALDDTFVAIRDLRSLHASDRPDFARRISWLYPDDGCFARAGIARRQIEDEWGHHVAKLFSFGDLSVSTPNSPSGRVRWAWHVVPVVKVAGTLYVIDPAIDVSQPLTAEEWGLRQVPDIDNAHFAICANYAYMPWGRCGAAVARDEASAGSDQLTYLNHEWSRLESLGRDPEAELGDHPPWETGYIDRR